MGEEIKYREITIPGHGPVNFPVDMSDADIVSVIVSNFPELAPTVEPSTIEPSTVEQPAVETSTGETSTTDQQKYREITIPGHGPVNFPVDMSDADIVSAIVSNFPELAPTVEPPTVEQPAVEPSTIVEQPTVPPSFGSYGQYQHKSAPGESMLALVNKAYSPLDAVYSGAKKTIPGFQTQLGGILRHFEPVTKEEFNQLNGKPLSAYPSFGSYGQYQKKPDQIDIDVQNGVFKDYDAYVKQFKSEYKANIWLAETGERLVKQGLLSPKSKQFEAGTAEYYAEAITTSFLNFLPALSLSLLNPFLGFGMILAQSKGAAYNTGRNKGLGTKAASKYSELTMLAEGIPSLLPLRVLLNPTGKLIKDMHRLGVTEAVQEEFTALLQLWIDKKYINKNMTWGEIRQRLIDAPIVGYGTGALLAGVTHPIHNALTSKVERDNIGIVNKNFDLFYSKTFMNDFAVASLSPSIDQRYRPSPNQSDTNNKTDITLIKDMIKDYGNVPTESRTAAVEILKHMEEGNSLIDAKRLVDAAISLNQFTVDFSHAKGNKIAPSKSPVIDLVEASDFWKDLPDEHKKKFTEEFTETIGNVSFEGEKANIPTNIDKTTANKVESPNEVKFANYADKPLSDQDQARATTDAAAIEVTEKVLNTYGKESVQLKRVASNIIQHFFDGKKLSEAIAIEVERDESGTRIFVDKYNSISKGKLVETPKKTPSNTAPTVQPIVYKGADKRLINAFGDSLIVQAAIMHGGLNREDFEISDDYFKKGSGFQNGVVGRPFFAAGDKGLTTDAFLEWAGEQPNAPLFEDVNAARTYVQDMIAHGGTFLSIEKQAQNKKDSDEEAEQAQKNIINIDRVQLIIKKYSNESIHINKVATNIISHMQNEKTYDEALDIEMARDKAGYALYLDKALIEIEIERAEAIKNEQTQASRNRGDNSHVEEEKSSTIEREKEQEQVAERIVTVSPIDKAILETFTTAVDAVQWVESNAKEPVFREIAKTIKALINPETTVVLSGEGGRTKGKFRYKENAKGDVLLNELHIFNEGMNEATLIHELIHVATAITMAKESTQTPVQKKAIAELRAVVSDVLKADHSQLTDLEHTAISHVFLNLPEFITHALTNITYQSALKKLKAKNERQTLFTKLSKAIKSLLGINDTPLSLFARAIDASSAVINSMQNAKPVKKDPHTNKPPRSSYLDHIASTQKVKADFETLKEGEAMTVNISGDLGYYTRASIDFRNFLDSVNGHINENKDGTFTITLTKVLPVKTEVENYNDKHPTIVNNVAMDQPMKNWQPTFSVIGMPELPASGTFRLRNETITLGDPHEGTRREGVTALVIGLIGNRVYTGKIKGKTRKGFYKLSNSEVRIADYGDIEILMHELAHYLDFHYTKGQKYDHVEAERLKDKHNLFRNAYNSVSDEIKNLSYTSVKGLVDVEGFAEYVRLWMTQYNEALSRAPNFTKKFEAIINHDPHLRSKMYQIQEQAHRWYLQGDLARGYAVIGHHLTSGELKALNEANYNVTSMSIQRVVDGFHGAKFMLHKMDAYKYMKMNAYKELQLIRGGIEGIVNKSFYNGALYFDDEGNLHTKGPSLNDVWQESRNKGVERLLDQELYFVALRAQSLTKQNREKLFDEGMIEAALKLADQYPYFKQASRDYEEYKINMMDFYVKTYYITRAEADAMLKNNPFHVPLNRVVEGVADIYSGSGFKQLKGSRRNIKPVYDNILKTQTRHIYAALKARALRELMIQLLNHRAGSEFISEIPADVHPETVMLDQMAQKVARVMTELGMSVNNNGINEAASEVTVETKNKNYEAIMLYFKAHPEQLLFWSFGHKPKVLGANVESYLDEEGKRHWVEVRSELLQDMLDNMDGVALPAELYMRNLLRAAMGIKNLHTLSITAQPQFFFPNIHRDQVGAYIRSGGEYTPYLSVFSGFKEIIFNIFDASSVMDEMIIQGGPAGGKVRQILQGTVGFTTDQVEYKIRSNLHPLEMGRGVLMAYLGVSDAFELATRVSYYKMLRKRGVPARQAAWMAREITVDWSKHGSNATFVSLQRTASFAGAQVQAVHNELVAVLEKEGETSFRNLLKHDQPLRNKIIKAGFYYVAVHAAIALMGNEKDKEKYQDLTADQKVRFFNYYYKGVHYSSPKAHGIWSIFGQLAEQLIDGIYGQDDFSSVMAFSVAYHFGLDMSSNLYRPVFDVWVNKKFTGADIVQRRLKAGSPSEQYTPRTGLVYVNAAQWFKKHLGVEVSPDITQYLMNGYLSYIESAVSGMLDRYMWDEKIHGKQPFKFTLKRMLFKQFKREFSRSKYTRKYYELLDAVNIAEIDLANAKYNFSRTGMDKVTLAGESELIGVKKELTRYSDELRDLRQNTLIIWYDVKNGWSAKEKEKRINEQRETTNKTLKQVFLGVKSALDKMKQRKKEDNR